MQNTQNLFEKKLQDYLTVYKVPIGPDDLDPSLFVYSAFTKAPQFNPQIAAQIIKDLEAFTGEQPTRIKQAFLVGKALVPGTKSRTCPLNVLILLNKDLMDIDIDGLLAEELLNLAKSLSGRLAIGTTHPINYSLTTRDIDPSDYEGIYDLSKGSWYKIPNGLRHA